MNGQNDASIGINIKTDDQGVERLKQLFPALDRAAQSLKQTFSEVGSLAQRQIGTAVQSMSRMAGGFSSEDFSRFQQGRQRYLREARAFNKEQVRLIEERIQDERRAEESRHRGAVSAAGLDPRARAAEVDRHRWEESWLRNDRFRSRNAEARRYDTEVEAIHGLRPGDPGGGDGGGPSGAALAGRGLLRTLGMFGAPVSIGAALYGAVRAGNEAANEYDIVRRIGSYQDQNVTHFNTVRDRLLTVPGLSYAEASRGMGAFVGQAGNRPGMAREAMGLGIGFGIGGQAGAESFGSFARAGVTTDETSQRRFAEILGEHIIQAQMRGREGEVFRRLSEFLETSARFSLGRPDTAGYLDLQMRLLNAAPDEAARTALRGGAGQAIFGAVHGSIAGTQLFPNVGQGLLKSILFSVAGRSGRNPAQMQELLESNPLALLPEVLKHPLANAPGGMGDLMVSQMFNIPVQFARVLRKTPEVAGMVAGMDPALQGRLMNERDPLRVGMYMSAIEEYRTGDRSMESRDTLSARLTEISKGPRNAIEAFQEEQARLGNELNKLLFELTPLVTELITGIANLTKAINDVLEWGRGKWGEEQRRSGVLSQEPGALPPEGTKPYDPRTWGFRITPPQGWEGTLPFGPPDRRERGEGRDASDFTAQPGRLQRLWNWLKPKTGPTSWIEGRGTDMVPASWDASAGGVMPPVPSALARTKYGPMMAAWSAWSGYPEELGWATLMGESGARGTNAGTPVSAGDAGMSFGPMQLNARFFPTAPAMSEKENVWTGLVHLKKLMDARGVLGGVTGYMGKGPLAEGRARTRLALAQYLPSLLAPSVAEATTPGGSSGVSSSWGEPTQGDRPVASDDLARSFRVAVRVSIDPLSIIVRNAVGEVTDQQRVQPNIQWQGQSGPMTTEVAP